MFRRGPSKSTPANVQCQKCLKRGHYSYECKASTQERPYVPRPSRTQQLFNPKLVPKLASDDAPAPAETKGIADQELAKRESERARQRQLEEGDDADQDVPRPRRSPSYDSPSTTSTREASPPSRRRVSVSPERANRAARHLSPLRKSSRGRSYDSGSDYERRYSPSPRGYSKGTKSSEPARQRIESLSHDDSPPRRRFDTDERPMDRRPVGRRRSSVSQSPRGSPPQEDRSRFRSRSPQGSWRRGNVPRHDGSSGARHENSQKQKGTLPTRETRKRSLSPFSKRLALTQAMNVGLQ
ncbi:zinc knuckle-domain-containing protein [Xylaria sp. CBS 124048]|nr:zinc knuckle-domain-containing protein [Xylaria sp. CBS 124048]